MAAVTSRSRIEVRAARPGEGKKIAALWRELWVLHEGWGGYASSHDDRVFDRLALRLDEDARVRADYPVLGRHVHLIATVNGEIAGQVEGWFDRHGFDPATPATCEVRSLVVSSHLRKVGVGEALLSMLAKVARDLARNARTLLVAEVLEPNPAHTFYARMGFSPISWSAFVSSRFSGDEPSQFSARRARADDALALAMLEGPLAERRRAAGDARFDLPHAVDATLVGAIAAHLGRTVKDPLDPTEIVVVDPRGTVRGAASFGATSLDPPFAPTRRAVLARFALDPAISPSLLMPLLVSFAAGLARDSGAPGIELVDLSSPQSALFQAAISVGARPWSRIVQREAE